MSSNENPSATSSPGDEGIRLPPISFISNQSPANSTSNYKVSSNLGISNFLNDPSPPPVEQSNKRVKIESAKVKENKEIEFLESNNSKPEPNAEKEDTNDEQPKSPQLEMPEVRVLPQTSNEPQEEAEQPKSLLPVDTKPKKRSGPPVTLDTEPIKELLTELFPSRQYLGTIIYNPTTTWETLQTSQLYGLKPEHHERFQEIKDLFEERSHDATVKYIPTIPPLSNDYINCVIEVKIPYAHIRRFKSDFETVIRKRELWGGAGGVYTDDSDLLCVLTHLGLFNNTIDLKQWNSNWVPADIIKPHAQESENDPQDIDHGVYGDLSIEILLLPRLPSYPGYYANEINSRSWIGNNKHRGLSIAIHNIKWESCGTYLRDKSIFKRYHQELIQDTQENHSNISQKQGWSFNYKYYKELKQKYSEVSDSK